MSFIHLHMCKLFQVAIYATYSACYLFVYIYATYSACFLFIYINATHSYLNCHLHLCHLFQIAIYSFSLMSPILTCHLYIYVYKII